MSALERLVAGAASQGLEFVVIGGQAVNALGYQRFTLDFDILVQRALRDRWLGFLAGEGYSLFSDGGSFLQMTASVDEMRWPLDLMLVDEDTFARMLADSREVRIQGMPLRVAAPLHLLALKLHALKTGPVERRGRDFLDIVEVLRAQALDPRSPEVADVFRRYGTMDWHDRVVEALPDRPTG